MRIPKEAIPLAILEILLLPISVLASPEASEAPKASQLQNRQSIDPVMEAKTSMRLQEFGEKQIKQSGPKQKCFRFQWYRSFHPAICITIHFRGKTSNTCIIEAKENNQPDSYPPRHATVVIDKRFSLSVEQEKELLKRINSEKFWQTDSYDELTMPASMRPKGAVYYGSIADGSDWILEGWDNGKYHLIERKSPSSGPAWNIGTMLLKLMKMFPDDPKEIY